MELGNALNWFEIPVENFDRAKKFYETIFNVQMPESTMGPARMGFFCTILRMAKWGCYRSSFRLSYTFCKWIPYLPELSAGPSNCIG